MSESMTEQRQLLDLVLEGLHDAINGQLVDDQVVWSDIGDLLAKAGESKDP